jgi:sucrose-6-phosphate hydrolase SacC (GH32 family)
MVLLLLAAAMAAQAADPVVFAFFRSNGETGVFLAGSQDGLEWKELNGGKAVILPPEKDALMRDPFLVRGPDGRFHLIWTWSWTAPFIGYSSSGDLLHWAPVTKIPVFAGVAGVRNVWAPEMVWDRQRKHWLIFWATTIDGRFTETGDSVDRGMSHRIYAMTTRDFRSFTEPKVWFDPGHPVIDSTLTRDGKRWLMAYKDERVRPLRKHLLLAEAAGLEGPWRPLGDAFTETWSEGPSIIRFGGEWRVYYDHYRDPAGYRLMVSKDLKAWRDETASLKMPDKPRHGSFLTVRRKVFDRLAQ